MIPTLLIREQMVRANLMVLLIKGHKMFNIYSFTDLIIQGVTGFTLNATNNNIELYIKGCLFL